NAAVDRQHPRDLFDVKLLYDNEGLTDDLFRTFLIYIASSPRPAHELLNPNLIDLDKPYIQEFEGMTRTSVSLEELLHTRKRLIADIHSRFDENTKRFLLSLHDGSPDFDAIDRPRAAELPAVRWKLIHLEKLKNENAAKHAEQRHELKVLLG
ncbi:MAG: nucleotidyl transferase AbiEii/AbiGii toxin family protein, partial [Gammaproteobacteria bacterium]|nr:nucleotidyl transferase AbiEii/AbiGii toxin family protein [Gammaproteobacteria bacterium]